MDANLVTRYVITHIDTEGNRTLAFGTEGRWTYFSEEIAKVQLELFRPQLESKMGMKGLEVRPVTCYCYPSGTFQPTTCWFDEK